MPIITWKDVNEAYPETVKLADATQADSSFVMYGIAELESRLSSKFTAPFSTNNLTARDLAIDLTYARLYRFKDQEKYKAISESIDGRIDRLLQSKDGMILTDGTQIFSVGGTVYSTTEDYHPVFGVSPVEYLEVSSQQVIDEERDRGHI